jgi:FkbM family methyltransferase
MVRPPADPVQVVDLPWGCPLEIDIRETIGRSVWSAGVYDLAVVEVLTRLAVPDRLAIDAGANIGALTGALAARAGEVWAFEPHPQVRRRLEANVGRFAGRPGFAPCRVFDIALSDADGTARLEIPDEFAGNQGLAKLGTEGIAVPTARLDGLLAGREVGVMKVDVEGHELGVFQGTAESLAAGRIGHVVFEEHAGPDSPACRFLTDHGYHLFEVGWRLAGPVLSPPGRGGARRYEAPSLLATRHPDQATAACRPRGWRCFRRPGGSR